jgi:hypothetical protein
VGIGVSVKILVGISIKVIATSVDGGKVGAASVGDRPWQAAKIIEVIRP